MGEGVLAVEHFVDAGPDGPDVGLAVVLAVAQHLGGHVEGTAQHGVGVVFPHQQFGKAEVGDLDLALVQQNVGQFEVAVHDLVGGEGLEGIQDLPQVGQHFLLRDLTLLPHLRQHVSPVAVLQHEVVVVRSLLEGYQFDDVGVVAGLEHFDFVFEQFVEFA